MAWTYSGNPASSKKDEVRYLVGDTQVDSPLSTDEEIAWALSQNANNANNAAVWVAKAISAYFSTLAEITEIGPIKIQYGKRSESYEKRAKELERNSDSKFTSVIAYAGGISKADKATLDDDNATVFKIGQDDLINNVEPLTE